MSLPEFGRIPIGYIDPVSGAVMPSGEFYAYLNELRTRTGGADTEIDFDFLLSIAYQPVSQLPQVSDPQPFPVSASFVDPQPVGAGAGFDPQPVSAPCVQGAMPI